MSDTTSQSHPSEIHSSVVTIPAATADCNSGQSMSPVNQRYHQHAQNMFLEFTDEDTEARFIQYRFVPPGLYFPCILSYALGVTLLLSTSMDATADTIRDPLSKWFFQNYTWYSSERMFGFYAFCVTSGLFALAPTALLLYNKFVQHGTPMSGKHLEMFYVFMACVYQSHHSYFDLRYTAFCVDDGVSLLLRDGGRPQSGKCEDFVEPYVLVTTLAAFILPARLRNMTIFVLPWLPTPFLLRTTLLNFDNVFRTSDAVWFFTYLVFIIGFIANEHILRRQFIQHEDLQKEIEDAVCAQDAVRRLLNAMLPVSVLKRLIANEVVADCGEVSVVFSDVVGFTSWCSTQSAEEVVRMLNTMYNHFDNGLAQYSIEKIKTIGDAYWAVCGLPDPNPNHVLHVCAFAKYMQRCVKILAEDDSQHHIRIRIGVHSGQLCGGVVGKQQRAYDMFGTTNEVAELMEQKSPVDCILLSEPAYRHLKKSFGTSRVEGGTLDGSFSVELYEPSVETIQGTMASYVLKTFTWAPRPTTLSILRPLDPTLSYSAIAHIPEREALHPADVAESHSIVQTSTRPPSHSENSDTDTTHSVTSESQHSATADNTAQMMHELKQQQEKLFKASHKLHHTFDNEEVEAEFQQFMLSGFPHKLQAISSMHAIMVLIIYIVMLAEGRSHPWYVHLLMATNFVVAVAQLGMSVRVPIHPLVGLATYYAECNTLLITLLISNRSVVSNDLVYIMYNFIVFFPTLGFVGGGIPYIYICVASIVFLTMPTMTLMVVMNSIYVAHVHIPVHCAAVWIIALRRSEIGQRQQFKDKTLAEKVLHRTQKQHRKVSELISRMMPSFMVDELTVWVCGPRDRMIADNFTMIGVLFTRFPALRDQFSDKSVDPLTVMQLIGNYVNICDDVVEKHSACIKLKTIGDVQLFASGLIKQQTGYNSNPLSAKDSADAWRIETTSSASTTENNEVSRSGHHLVALAHLAVSISNETTKHFKANSKISAGMHCGPATAGVIGNDRLIYDVFGDTVNVASRVMTTSGEGMWGSSSFCSKICTIPDHGLQIGDRVERTVKGKGVISVNSIAATPYI